jgi:hypothetical protein
MYNSGQMRMVVRPLKSMQYWSNTTCKYLFSAVTEGMINMDSPGINSLLCLSLHNISEFSDKVPFTIEWLDDSVE